MLGTGASDEAAVGELAQRVQQHGPVVRAPGFPGGPVPGSPTRASPVGPSRLGAPALRFPKRAPGQAGGHGGLICSFLMCMVTREAQAAPLEPGVDLRVPGACSRSASERISADVPSARSTHSMDLAFFDDAMFMFFRQAGCAAGDRAVGLAVDAFGSGGIRLRAASCKIAVLFQFGG
ncbi:unnamed protein product, partial [Prorocentrum cordatum]